MLAWRRRHPQLLLTVVRGNHDAMPAIRRRSWTLPG
jgi:hypothetical protein